VPSFACLPAGDVEYHRAHMKGGFPGVAGASSSADLKGFLNGSLVFPGGKGKQRKRERQRERGKGREGERERGRGR